MKKVRNVLFVILVVQLNVAFSQLKKGENAPKIIFEKSFPVNYNLPKNKPIMLDFWATWCAPCIAGLRESNSLIDTYQDKIEFLCITDSTSKNVKQFIKTNKLKHQFLINDDQTTFKNYKIQGLPTAFLIDTNGVIQWQGNGLDLTSKLLDQFLETGKVGEGFESKNISFSSIQKAKGDFIFDISEIKSVDKNAFPMIMLGAKGDSISYSIQNLPLRGIIELLHDNQVNQIMYKLKDPEVLNTNFSLSVFARHVDKKTIDYSILKMLGANQNFAVSIKKIDTLAYVFKVENEKKFNSFKTKLDASGVGAEDYSMNFGEDANGKPILSGVNLKLIQFQGAVSQFYETLIVFPNLENVGFNFDNIILSDFDKFKKQMLESYGLSLAKEKTNIPFLIIEN